MKIRHNFCYECLAAKRNYQISSKLHLKHLPKIKSSCLQIKQVFFMNLRPLFTRKESQSTCLIQYDLKAECILLYYVGIETIFLKNLLSGMKVAFDTARSTQNLAMVIMNLIYLTCKKHYHLKESNLNITGRLLSSLKASSQN